jgi:asparagine synthase (glutamine-hydrolysing)
MIFGVVNRALQSRVDRDSFDNAAKRAQGTGASATVRAGKGYAFSYCASFDMPGYQQPEPVVSQDGNIVVNFAGRIHNSSELFKTLNGSPSSRNDQHASTLILRLYQKFGRDFVQKLNGKFAFAILDKERNEALLGRDRIGIEPLYYYADYQNLLFASTVWPILGYSGEPAELNFRAMCKFLLFNYNPGLDTFWASIKKLRPGHLLIVNAHEVKQEPYWRLAFDDPFVATEEEIATELFGRLKAAVRRCLDPTVAPGVFVSGGMDSSSVLALAADEMDARIETFSYRCRGRSFDESHYARRMSDSVQSSHHEIEYTPGDLLCMTDLVRQMDEPFCDTGINVATHLLGKAARDEVSYVLTGDGGDELFGGHPVYEADKIAAFIDPIPQSIKHPLLTLASRLPDTDQKKSLFVKVKRFAESLNYPKSLLSHRWRVYYQPADLQELLTADTYDCIADENLYSDMQQYAEEACSAAPLSRSLYSDYCTVVDFYLRRNDLNRQFRLETRFPLLDHELVEYCARVPPNLKIKGWFDTKYIFKKTMEAVLPHEIVHRKDKLGHSIPMKNWLRENTQVREFILDHLSSATILKRGYFKSTHVSKLINDHLQKKRNNAHRLWTLAVLEMWLRQRVDNKDSGSPCLQVKV